MNAAWEALIRVAAPALVVIGLTACSSGCDDTSMYHEVPDIPVQQTR